MGQGLGGSVQEFNSVTVGLNLGNEMTIEMSQTSADAINFNLDKTEGFLALDAKNLLSWYYRAIGSPKYLDMLVNMLVLVIYAYKLSLFATCLSKSCTHHLYQIQDGRLLVLTYKTFKICEI